jgi:hypothetical protein
MYLFICCLFIETVSNTNSVEPDKWMNVDLYIHSPIRLHGVVLNYLSTEANLPLPLSEMIMEGNRRGLI